MIVAAAIKTSDGKVWVGARHPLVYPVIARSLGLDYHSDEEWSEDDKQRWFDYKRGYQDGFVDDAWNFLTRDEAMAHVEAIKQFLTPRRQEHPGAVLTSEDLW